MDKKRLIDENQEFQYEVILDDWQMGYTNWPLPHL